MEHCPNCDGGEFKIIAAILERSVIEKILIHLGLQAQLPPKAPALDACRRVRSRMRDWCLRRRRQAAIGPRSSRRTSRRCWPRIPGSTHPRIPRGNRTRSRAWTASRPSTLNARWNDSGSRWCRIVPRRRQALQWGLARTSAREPRSQAQTPWRVAEFVALLARRHERLQCATWPAHRSGDGLLASIRRRAPPMTRRGLAASTRVRRRRGSRSGTWERDRRVA